MLGATVDGGFTNANDIAETEIFLIGF